MSVQQLPKGVIKLISSTQVINSVSSVIKELLENSIDAGATSVDIKLERNGLDKIEIRDNGSGINISDVYNVCFSNYTSKIHNFNDLEHLQSYGFRGEALHSLCAVSLVSITTKTQDDEVASTYMYDNDGTIREVKSSHQMNGTIVTVTNLFKNVPVRKQYYENSRKGTEELKKIEKVVKQFSIIHPKLRVTLAHNKCLIWHKTSVYSLRQSLMQVYPHAVLKQMEDVSCELENVSIDMLIAKRECNLSVLCQPVSEAILLYVNQRPVKDKKIEKVVLEEMNHLYASTLPLNKCPLTLISLKLSPGSLDVNLEPNKTKVFIKDHENVLKQVRERIMLHFYQQPRNDDLKTLLLDADELQNPPKKRKLEDNDDELNDDKRIANDLDVSKMRNLVIEKTNVNAEKALKELADISFSDFEDDVNSTSIATVRENENVSDLKNIHTNTLNCLIPDSNSEESKLQLNSESNNADDLNSISCTNLFEDTLSLPKSSLDTLSAEIRHPPTTVSTDGNFVAPIESNLSEKSKNTEKNEYQSCSKLAMEILQSSSVETPLSSASKEEKNTTVSSGTKSSDSTVKNITLSQWSRGGVTIENKPLDNGVILFNSYSSERNLSAEKDTPKNSTKKTKVVNDDASQTNSLNRSVSSQMGRKDMVGFTNFARQIRSDIIKETPGMSFTKVAGELANRCRNLHEVQKNSYKEDAKLKQKPITSNLNVMFKKKTLALTISMNQILEELKIPGGLCQRSGDSKIYLIGPLESGKEWLYKMGDDINVVNVPHLRENVLFHRYICNSSIPLGQLDEPIKITSEILGTDLWNYLLSLERNHEDNDEISEMISDSRITKSGFEVVISKGDLDQEEVLITKTAKETDFGVIENFIETLNLASRYKELEQCRTDVIKKMLLSKVAEVCEQKSVPRDVTEIRMLLQYWAQCMYEKKICSHDEPISVNLHRL